MGQIELAKEGPQSSLLETNIEDNFDYFKELPISSAKKSKKTEISKVNNPDGYHSFTSRVKSDPSCLNKSKFKNNLNSTSFGSVLSPPLQIPKTFEITPNLVLNSLKHKQKVLSGHIEEEKEEENNKIKIDLDTYEVTKQEASPEIFEDTISEVGEAK